MKEYKEQMIEVVWIEGEDTYQMGFPVTSVVMDFSGDVEFFNENESNPDGETL
jgi:hypothetical protein